MNHGQVLQHRQGLRPETRTRSAGWAACCGGIAAKLNVDVAFVRIAFLVFCLLPGPAVVFYLAAWLILPDQQNSIPLQTFLDRRSINGS